MWRADVFRPPGEQQMIFIMTNLTSWQENCSSLFNFTLFLSIKHIFDILPN